VVDTREGPEVFFKKNGDTKEMKFERKQCLGMCFAMKTPPAFDL
jgi:hypothetical protein